jgi:hypothetical protein
MIPCRVGLLFLCRTERLMQRAGIGSVRIDAGVATSGSRLRMPRLHAPQRDARLRSLISTEVSRPEAIESASCLESNPDAAISTT